MGTTSDVRALVLRAGSSLALFELFGLRAVSGINISGSGGLGYQHFGLRAGSGLPYFEFFRLFVNSQIIKFFGNFPTFI